LSTRAGGLGINLH